MNLHGKQIGHVLGYIPVSLYGQAVLQGMSRAYQGVLEEANRRIVEFRLRATTPASSAMTPLTPPSAAPPADLLAVAQSKAVPPASGVSGFDMGLSPPTPPAFNTSGEAFSLLRMSRPAMPAPLTPEGVFGPMPVGGAMIGGDAAPQTPYCSYDPGYPSGDYDYCPDDPGYQATMTSAPTTLVSYPFQMEESRPPHQWNYPIYEGKGEDMRLQMSKGIGKGRLPAYEREYPLFELGVNLPMPPPPPEEYAGVPTTPPMPRPAGVESPPPPPSPDAMSEASDSAVLERGF